MKKIKGIISPTTADAIAPQAKPGYKAGNPIIDKNYEQLRETIISIAEVLRQNAKTSAKLMSPEVSRIIRERLTDRMQIERTLDTLLGLVSLGECKKDFLRLNNYYENIDKDGADFYMKEYRAALLGQ